MIPRAEKQQVLVATDRPNGRSVRRKMLDEVFESMSAPVLGSVSFLSDHAIEAVTVRARSSFLEVL